MRRRCSSAAYAAIGIDLARHDIRFVEDDWESPTLGAWGLGWEVWCDGMEVTQFTYFQQVGGITCALPSMELTYGLERLAMYVQGVENVYDLDFNGRGVKYGDIFLRAERDYSRHNFEVANTEMLARHFVDAENECQSLLNARPCPARLRPVHQGEPPLQSARRARRHQRDRARRLYRPGAQRLRAAAAKPGSPESRSNPMADLLLELFSEEIPARMQAQAAETLARLLAEALGRSPPAPPAPSTARAASPGWARSRPRSPPRRISERGPKLGAPDQALAGFLRKHGADARRSARGWRLLSA